VICDVLDHHTHDDLPHSPRAILKKQVKRLTERGYIGYFASELEFYLFSETYDSARKKHWQGLDTASPYIGDYQIGITTKEEGVMRRLRNEMEAAGIPIENSKGEWGPGQEEINVKYADALTMADRHVVMKNAIKEIAHFQGKAVTFMAKWDFGLAGSSSHIHMSLAGKGKNAFLDPKAEHGMSELMRHYVAGQLAHAQEVTYFLAPYINSYKRFQAGTFAPTKAIWSRDNRTAGFRLCGENSNGVRVECRIGGADLNPYLAYAALIAAGLQGVEDKLELEPVFSGDAYNTKRLREVHKTLRDATAALKKSKMLSNAFGQGVVDHYVHTAEWEQFEYDRRVTDWELKRGFERS
jgi:glutamine synthetase